MFPNSIAVNARCDLALHALNNEGTYRSSREIRRLQVFGPSNLPVVVPGVSGAMLKHIYYEQIVDVADEMGLPLSSLDRVLNPMRAGDVKRRQIQMNKNTTYTGEAIKTSVADDLCGFMATGENIKATTRNSIVQFAWMPAIPGNCLIESKQHSRFTDSVKSKAEKSGEEKSENTGQMRFSNELASGIFAFSVYLRTRDICFDRESGEYVQFQDQQERKKRLAACLEALYRTLVYLNGACRNGCLPHHRSTSGIVSVSYSLCPAPSASPLENNYCTQVQELSTQLAKSFWTEEDRINEKVQAHIFNSLADLGEVLRSIVEKAKSE